MSFWNAGASSQPKRNYRFLIQFASSQTNGEVKWWAKTVSLPSFDISEVEVHFMDQRHYYPGRTTWNEVSMTLVDPISVDAVQDTVELLSGMGYNIADNGLVAKKTIDKTTSPLITGTTVTISVFNAGSTSETSPGVFEDVIDPIEVWTLNNAFVKSAKFGDLDYSNDELKQIDMTLRYDHATCQVGDADGDGPLDQVLPPAP